MSTPTGQLFIPPGRHEVPAIKRKNKHKKTRVFVSGL